jgi:hypothetical protein
MKLQTSKEGTMSGERWRVAKKLQPGQPGTLKLARRYGDALLCVRYRHDEQRGERCTTVELVIDRTPLQQRAQRQVAIRLRFDERALRATLHEAGGRWDKQAGVWLLPYRTAKALGLKDRVVRT